MGFEMLCDNFYMFSIIRGWWIQNDLEEDWTVETQIYEGSILTMLIYKNKGWIL